MVKTTIAIARRYQQVLFGLFIFPVLALISSQLIETRYILILSGFIPLIIIFSNIIHLTNIYSLFENDFKSPSIFPFNFKEVLLTRNALFICLIIIPTALVHLILNYFNPLPVGGWNKIFFLIPVIIGIFSMGNIFSALYPKRIFSPFSFNIFLMMLLTGFLFLINFLLRLINSPVSWLVWILYIGLLMVTYFYSVKFSVNYIKNNYQKIYERLYG